MPLTMFIGDLLSFCSQAVSLDRLSADPSATMNDPEHPSHRPFGPCTGGVATLGQAPRASVLATSCYGPAARSRRCYRYVPQGIVGQRVAGLRTGSPGRVARMT